MLLNQPFRLKNLYLFLTVLEAFALTAIIPWVTIAMTYQDKILSHYQKPSPEMYSQESVSYIFTGMSIFGTLGYVLFEICKRRANKAIYKR